LVLGSNSLVQFSVWAKHFVPTLNKGGPPTEGTCILLTVVRIPAGHLHTAGNGQNTCRAPAYSWHWSGYLQGTCMLLALVRIPAGHLHTPDSGQDTCRAPAYCWQWSGYLQGTCILLAMVRIPGGHLHTPLSDQDVKERRFQKRGWH